MNFKSFTTRLALGLTAAAALVAPTKSEAALTYNDGDLFLGFRATGGTGSSVDYLVDLGSYSQFTNASTPFTLSLGSIGADLDAQYGSWQNRADFLWSVSGVQKVANTYSANTMFVTNMHTTNLTLGVQDSTAWTRPGVSTAQSPALKMQNMGSYFAMGSGQPSAVESTNSSFALIQPTGNSNSYRSFFPGGLNTTGSSDFGLFNSANGIEGNFGAGAAGTVLDLYTVVPGSGASQFTGTFSISNNATVTFTPVPEPASFAAIGGGLAVLASIRRRRVNA